MSYTIENNILPHITGKQTLDEIPVDELIEITRQYPAFGAAKFLLAKKTQKENHPGSNKYIQSAVLHFPNQYWFHFKLNEEQLMKEQMLSSQKITPQAKPLDVIEKKDSPAALEIEKAVVNLAPAAPVTAQQQGAGAEDQEELAKGIQQAESITEQDAGKIEAIAAEDTPAPEHQLVSQKEESAEVLQVQEDVADVQSTPLAATSIFENITKEIPTPELKAAETLELTEPVVGPKHINEDPKQPENISGQEFFEPAEVPTADEDVRDKAIAAGENERLVAQDAHEISTKITEEIITEEHPFEYTPQPGALPAETEEQREADDTDGFEDADAENEAFLPTLGNEKISSVLQEQVDEFKKPVAEDTPVPIETEPYHTIDYFASQGIKLSAELQKQDHLSVKVKKFTDWLKQMKRINPTPADLGIDEATEHKVQDSAANSNEAREVVTEAMAEVFAMQGMTEKAIQVYIKLSFLDPSKTAYFASKIEKLKGI